MERAQFWTLVENSRKAGDGDLDEQMDALREKLAELQAKELVDFDRILNELMAQSYHWDLWGAAYIINGGCSDDGFEYFRGWLIAQGRTVFDGAMKDPESLVDVAEAGVECEDFLILAADVYEAKDGEELPRIDVAGRFELKGEQWKEEDLDRRYPKLAEKFGG